MNNNNLGNWLSMNIAFTVELSTVMNNYNLGN